jgi:hypothetical protein
MKRILWLSISAISLIDFTAYAHIKSNEEVHYVNVEDLLVDEEDTTATIVPVAATEEVDTTPTPSDAVANNEEEQEDNTNEQKPQEANEPSETGPGHYHHRPYEVDPLYIVVEEGDEPTVEKMAQIPIIKKNMSLYIGGRLKDDFFMYNRVYTLRQDFDDNNDFFRHRLNLDFLVNQGPNPTKKPQSQLCVRLSNYVFWGQEANFLPITVDAINLPALDNVTIAQNIQVKTLMPLVFVEQAWFKLNFDNFASAFKDKPTLLKIGYFPYILGRGVTMGFHEDLAVDYIGWAGQGGYYRYPFMPPGILFRTQLCNNLTWDVYFNQWRETNASISDTLAPTRQCRLFGQQPQRGTGKDRTTWTTRLDYKNKESEMGDVHLQPYLAWVHAPEQGIEFLADASSELVTLGTMLDLKYNRFSVNIELAGQVGHQRMHAIDRNVPQLTRSQDGSVKTSFSHVTVLSDISTTTNPALQSQAPIGEQNGVTTNTTDPFDPTNDHAMVVLQQNNRSLDAQGAGLTLANGTKAQPSGIRSTHLTNATVFGNARFRPAYSLAYQGFMALLDLSYEFEKYPFRLATSFGHISGDNYPYNEEVNQTYHGFIPLRSRYLGLEVRNFMIFDRLVIPRPLNISYRTLYAYNDLKDLSNLQFIGLGLTYYPIKNRKKWQIDAEATFFWEAAQLFTWDVNGQHPDPNIENQLKRLRNTPSTYDNPTAFVGQPTLFSGWESNKYASRMLGTEIDVKSYYQILDHCDFFVRFAFFVPGNLYKDLAGQPNLMTQYTDQFGYQRNKGLGSSTALAFNIGLNYKF